LGGWGSFRFELYSHFSLLFVITESTEQEQAEEEEPEEKEKKTASG